MSKGLKKRLRLKPEAVPSILRDHIKIVVDLTNQPQKKSGKQERTKV